MQREGRVGTCKGKAGSKHHCGSVELSWHEKFRGCSQGLSSCRNCFVPPGNSTVYLSLAVPFFLSSNFLLSHSIIDLLYPMINKPVFAELPVVMCRVVLQWVKGLHVCDDVAN